MEKFINVIKERFVGIVKSPVNVLGNIMNEKKWQGALAFLLIASFVLTLITAPVILKLNLENNPELYSSLPASDGILVNVLMGFAAVFVYLVRLIIITFFIYLFFSIFGAEGLFTNYFSLVVNSFLLTVFIPELIKSFYLLIFERIVNPFNLGVFLNSTEKSSWLYYIFTEIGIFQIWFIFLIAYGIFGFYQLNKDKWEEQVFTLKKSFIIAITYFMFKSIIVILFSYLFAKLAVAAQQMIMSS